MTACGPFGSVAARIPGTSRGKITSYAKNLAASLRLDKARRS
jgi:hypothetical protein